jgi:hypothetical protein
MNWRIVMEQPLLSDKEQFPSEEVIFSHIGKAKALWISLFQWIHSQHPDFCEEWRYYQDGKSWLLKVTQKKKTVFWLSLAKESFRTTFYFSDKAEEMILASPLSKEYKEQFINGKRYNRIRGITISYAKKKDLEEAKTLMEIKSRIK